MEENTEVSSRYKRSNARRNASLDVVIKIFGAAPCHKTNRTFHVTYKQCFRRALSNLLIFPMIFTYVHLFSSSAVFSVRGRCSRWPVSEALPLFPQLVVPEGSWSPPPQESNTYSQRRPFHRRGCRSEEEAGRGPLCGRRGRRPPHCLQRIQSRRQTLAEQCSSSLLHSAAPYWPQTSDQHTWTCVKCVKYRIFNLDKKHTYDNRPVTDTRIYKNQCEYD